MLPPEEHCRWIWFGGLEGESLGDEWRSARRQRFGANTPWSGKGWIVLDSRIDFCWTWSFTFSSNHSIIANGWTLSEQMAINLTGLIPLRYLSCVSAASATLCLTQPGIAARAHTQNGQRTQAVTPQYPLKALNNIHRTARKTLCTSNFALYLLWIRSIVQRMALSVMNKGSNVKVNREKTQNVSNSSIARHCFLLVSFVCHIMTFFGNACEKFAASTMPCLITLRNKPVLPPNPQRDVYLKIIQQY